ncbi:hypothetical protein ACFY0G_17535 [Streptomyces sp. NPDC001552]|uniref:hypothetical protein n=1 Tax=Streptomyces sp. NPDC001552 TaxID=3364587 RepID=UPI0036A29FC1
MTPPRRTALAPQQRGLLAMILFGKPPVAGPEKHYYHCGVCRTKYGPAASRLDARALRTRHRNDKHGGGAPDGETITGPPPPPRYPKLRAVRTAFERCLIAVGLVCTLILVIATW